MNLIWALILFLNILFVLGQNGRGFIKTNANLFDEIHSSNEPKTLIECCGHCGTFQTCQGVTFDGNTCTAINNVIPNFRARYDEVAWIDAELFKQTKKLLIFGGSKDQTEVINLAFKSSHILPMTTQMSKSIGDKISDTQAMICDSMKDNAGNCQFFEIANPQEATMLDGVVSEDRTSALAIGIPELEGLWIVGGQSTRSTEIITKTGTQPGPQTPKQNIRRSCMVRINSTTYFMMGGARTSTKKNSWFCHMTAEDPQDWRWINGPDLQDQRESHGCISWHINDKVVPVVIGGTEKTSSEFLDLDTNEWYYGPSLDFVLEVPGIAEISNKNRNEIFLFGGKNGSNQETLNLIYKLKCDDQNQINTCHWFQMAQQLQINRKSGIVIQI